MAERAHRGVVIATAVGPRSIAPYVVASLPEVFRAERDSLPGGATVLLVTGAITDSTPDQIAEIQAKGYQVTVLYAGDGFPPGRIAGVPVISVGQELDADFDSTYPRDAIPRGFRRRGGE